MFDLANDRLSYSELLQPDAGYTLDFAVGMTYSLDLEALLGVPVALGMLGECESGSHNNPLYVLEAIRKSVDRIALFCNAGSIALPRKIISVHSLLESSVFQVKSGRHSNFHPKIWVLKYSREGNDSYIRLLVMSRNLTFDSSIDIVASLQGKIGEAASEKNQPLADSLRYVAQFAEKKKPQVELLADAVLKVSHFETSHPFIDYDFYPIGIRNHGKKELPLFGQKYNLFAVSPFLSDKTVNELTCFKGPRTLVTRKESVTQKIKDSFDHVYVTRDELSDNQYGAKQDIHAKMYYVTTNTYNYLYLGSANASDNAFNRNVECLLRLTYKPNCMGFISFSKDFIPDENCPYEELKNIPEPIQRNEHAEAIDDALREAVYAVKSASVSMEGDHYSVQVNSRPFKTAIQVLIAPLQRQASETMQQLKEKNVFSGLLLKELSEFYVLCAEEKRIIVKIPTHGIPKDRDQAIYRSVIDKHDKFLNYLSFALADDPEEIMNGFDEKALSEAENGEMENTTDNGFAVYEQLLRVFHRNPAKLRGVADMIKRLDPDVVGADFLRMFQHFEVAGKKVRK